MKKTIVTTSWDDGNELDLKLAELLKKYNLKGTFYVSPGNKHYSLSEEQIRELGNVQEVGGHTLSHPHLIALSPVEAEKEIIDSKKYLEDVLNKEIKSFSYPYGEFDKNIKAFVRRAGFLGARTVKDNIFEEGNDPFEVDTTLHVYPLSFWQRLRYFNWVRLAQKRFNLALKIGGMFHLWGHSWEIEKYDMWPQLEEVFKHISGKAECRYLNNGEVYENFNITR